MNISDRLRLVIEAVTPPTRRFVALEEATQIKAESWRTWWNRGGKASPDMIQTIARAYPEYALWIVTGITDQLFGHIAPSLYIDESGINMTRVFCGVSSSNNYLKSKIKAQMKKEKGVDPTIDDLYELSGLDSRRWDEVRANREEDDHHLPNTAMTKLRGVDLERD